MKPYFETKLGKLYHGDCLEIMPALEPVDLVLADPPYGTTACAWDSVLPFELMWKELKRLIKPNGAVVLTASQPFTTVLISSNMEMFKYCWVWDKVSKGDIMNAKNKPLKQHEDICIFSIGTTANCSNKRMVYFPIGLSENLRSVNRQNRQEAAFKGLRPSHAKEYKRQFTGYPSSILTISNADHTNIKHPTQKPVALMEYLIKTYTNKNETVLDFTIGSGTTAIACEKLNRRWIGIEISEEYCEIAKQRIINETRQLKLFV